MIVECFQMGSKEDLLTMLKENKDTDYFAVVQPLGDDSNITEELPVIQALKDPDIDQDLLSRIMIVPLPDEEDAEGAFKAAISAICSYVDEPEELEVVKDGNKVTAQEFLKED